MIVLLSGMEWKYNRRGLCQARGSKAWYRRKPRWSFDPWSTQHSSVQCKQIEMKTTMFMYETCVVWCGCRVAMRRAVRRRMSLARWRCSRAVCWCLWPVVRMANVFCLICFAIGLSSLRCVHVVVGKRVFIIHSFCFNLLWTRFHTYYLCLLNKIGCYNCYWFLSWIFSYAWCQSNRFILF